MRETVAIWVAVGVVFAIAPRIGKTVGRHDDRYGGTLNLAVTANPTSFNPILSNDSNTTDITNMMFVGLVRYDVQAEKIVPDLAARWEVKSGGLEYHFYLTPGIKWSDGHPITARDIEYTFNRIIFNPAIKTKYRSFLEVNGEPIVAKAVDPAEVVFKLPKRFAPFLRIANFPILPAHQTQPMIEAGTFDQYLSLQTDPAKVVVNGPFTLERFVPDQKIVLRKNIYYHRTDHENHKLPYLDRVNILVVPNQDVAFLKFYAGETDIYGLRGGNIRVEDLPVLRKMSASSKRYKMFKTIADFSTQFMVFNQNKAHVDAVKLKWFQDVQFRKAIAYAIDRNRIIQEIYGGNAEVQHTALTPSSGYFYNPNVSTYPFNPHKALAILKKQGYDYLPKRNILHDKAGNRVEFKLMTNINNTNRLRMCGIIRENLASIGIRIHFTPIKDFNVLVTKLLETYEWEAVVVGLTGEDEPHRLRNIWYYGGNLHLWNPGQSEPATPWERRISEIFEKASGEMDRGQRKKYYDEWQVLASEYLPLIYMVVPTYIAVSRQAVQNFYPKPNARNNAVYNIEALYKKPSVSGDR